jgi:di/tricarboxylate transporter
MTRKGLYTVSAIIFIALMALITVPPITAALERVTPHILGIPFFQFFLIGVPVAMAIWLAVWFVLECRIEDKAAEKAEKTEDMKKGGAEIE